MTRQLFQGASVFDGAVLHRDAVLVVENGRVAAITPAGRVPPGNHSQDGDVVRLAGGVLAPGFLDLQVNGGGGVMLDGDADQATIASICDAHLALGATGLLPTLITDTPDATQRVIAAGIAAARAGIAGFLGLHLEGPHIDPARKGAHDPALIRPMDAPDLARLCAAARDLPVLMVTLAPEAATPAQIGELVTAGAVVSLGHSDCSAATAKAAIAAGAGCVTHLFNAMSQLSSRAPGLVGAALDSPVFAGLIADGIHVAPESMRIALSAKRPPGLFLVSDAMAVAGTALEEFSLGGRRILRRDGRLTLADGTLAGADLTLPQAIRRLVRNLGTPLSTALAMATARPAACIRASNRLGHLLPGRGADIVHLDADLRLAGVWRAGRRMA